MTTTLQQSGFTDVKVMPDAFLVSAKDKSGDPVTMLINPNSMTEVIGTNAPAQSGATGAGAFATIPRTDDLSSKIVGLDVYNKTNQDIVSIKDIAFEFERCQSVYRRGRRFPRSRRPLRGGSPLCVAGSYNAARKSGMLPWIRMLIS